MASDRDDLKAVLDAALRVGKRDDVRLTGFLADVAVRAGWRPPTRVIETVEELDALPIGAVVRDSDSDGMRKFARREWEMFGQPGAYGERAVVLPATVLFEPEEGQ